jgi:hypothetical protein
MQLSKASLRFPPKMMTWDKSDLSQNHAKNHVKYQQRGEDLRVWLEAVLNDPALVSKQIVHKRLGLDQNVSALGISPSFFMKELHNEMRYQMRCHFNSEPMSLTFSSPKTRFPTFC